MSLRRTFQDGRAAIQRRGRVDSLPLQPTLEALMHQEPRQDSSQAANTGTLARMVRLTWKTLGGLVLFLLLILIVVGSQKAVFILDIVFWLAVAGLVAVRYADIAVFHGRTSDDKPATMKDWVNYSLGLFIMSGFFWILAHALKNRLQ